MKPFPGNHHSPSVTARREFNQVNLLSPPSADGWGEAQVDSLRQLSTELQTLSGQTEKDFLVIGAHLQDFYRQAGEISTMSASVADLMSGEEIAGAIHRLGEILQWLGFAIAGWSLPALAFVCFTAANLVPKALSSHRWYREHFASYPAERKAVFPFLV